MFIVCYTHTQVLATTLAYILYYHQQHFFWAFISPLLTHRVEALAGMLQTQTAQLLPGRQYHWRVKVWTAASNTAVLESQW